MTTRTRGRTTPRRTLQRSQNSMHNLGVSPSLLPSSGGSNVDESRSAALFVAGADEGGLAACDGPRALLDPSGVQSVQLASILSKHGLRAPGQGKWRRSPSAIARRRSRRRLLPFSSSPLTLVLAPEQCPKSSSSPPRARPRSATSPSPSPAPERSSSRRVVAVPFLPPASLLTSILRSTDSCHCSQPD